MPEKGTSTLRMRVCRQCGIEFMGGRGRGTALIVRRNVTEKSTESRAAVG